jgi:hypothetical protein
MVVAFNDGVVKVLPVPNKFPLAAALYQAVFPPAEEVNVEAPLQFTLFVPDIVGTAGVDPTRIVVEAQVVLNVPLL